MRYHHQNLTADYLDRRERSLFWAGRAWLYLNRKNACRETAHWEWAFGRYARSFAAWIAFGYGESGDAVCLHLCLPFLFSVYFVLNGIHRCKEQKSGIAIHDHGLWLYPLVWEDHWSREDPWWRKNHCWHFPWELNHWRTEILSHDLSKVIWRETSGQRLRFIDGYEVRQFAEKLASKDYPYTYRLKNGDVQMRTATVHVTRMEWRARWWPILRNRKISTDISTNFDQEVGEETGSWKGGCTGCGYEMKEGETPEQTLRRMEQERKFER